MPVTLEARERQQFAQGLGRAFAGAVLFALPLLMTMEMWWLGFYIDPARLALLLAGFFPVLIALSYFIGFDDTGGLVHDVVHALVAYGVGFVTAAVMLTALSELGPGMGFRELLGKVTVQVVPSALGALLAQAHFGYPREKSRRRSRAGYAGHLFFMVIGALYVGFTLAPTDEMVVLGYRLRDAHAAALGIVSIALLHAYTAGVGFEAHPEAGAPRQAPPAFFRLTLVGYALALAVSASLLWVFGRFDGVELMPAVHSTVVLGLPASIGAAAARLTLDIA